MNEFQAWFVENVSYGTVSHPTKAQHTARPPEPRLPQLRQFVIQISRAVFDFPRIWFVLRRKTFHRVGYSGVVEFCVIGAWMGSKAVGGQ